MNTTIISFRIAINAKTNVHLGSYDHNIRNIAHLQLIDLTAILDIYLKFSILLCNANAINSSNSFLVLATNCLAFGLFASNSASSHFCPSALSRMAKLTLNSSPYINKCETSVKMISLPYVLYHRNNFEISVHCESSEVQ